MKKQQANFRLTDDARNLLGGLSKKLGISQAAVVEIALRDLAERKLANVFPGDTSNIKRNKGRRK
jgi:hypothetical protein